MMNTALSMIDDFLNDKYEPWDFSNDLPAFMVAHYDEMQKENAAINDILNDEMPEICADYEMGESPENFKSLIRCEYDKIMALGC